MICKCRKHSRVFCWWCASQSLTFPLEHLLWERAPLFSSITRLLGL